MELNETDVMKIVVSGASSGIGFQLAKKLVAGGHEVLAFARSGGKLHRLEEETSGYTGKLHVLTFDLMSDNYQPLLSEVKQHLNTLDALVNNAGWLVNKPFLQLSNEDVSKTFQINVFSVFKLVRQLFPLMHQGTHIVNISSIGGFQGSAKFKGLSAYSASKGALSILTECMAEEFAGKGVKVNALALGATQTDMLAQAFPGYEAPLSATQMAGYIADFTLNGHKFFNGKIIPVSLSTP